MHSGPEGGQKYKNEKIQIKVLSVESDFICLIE